MASVVVVDGLLAALFLAVNAALFRNRKKPEVLFAMGWNTGMALGMLAVIIAAHVSVL